ncbi:Protein of unknown function [Gryllus bimaculatus]|nr:Protein of unknown function [Gryllus bimaculatus]
MLGLRHLVMARRRPGWGAAPSGRQASARAWRAAPAARRADRDRDAHVAAFALYELAVRQWSRLSTRRQFIDNRHKPGSRSVFAHFFSDAVIIRFSDQIYTRHSICIPSTLYVNVQHGSNQHYRLFLLPQAFQGLVNGVRAVAIQTSQELDTIAHFQTFSIVVRILDASVVKLRVLEQEGQVKRTFMTLDEGRQLLRRAQSAYKAYDFENRLSLLRMLVPPRGISVEDSVLTAKDSADDDSTVR